MSFGMVDVHTPLQDVRTFFLDFDNTLVDSASILGVVHLKVAESICRYLKSLNIELSVDEVAALIRKTEKEMEEQLVYDRDIYWERVMFKLGFDTLPRYLFREWTEIYWRYYSTAPVFPDVEPTLSSLRRLGYRLGMITNTDGGTGVKRRRLQNYDLMMFFDVVIVAGDDVDEIKPSPKPFLKASELMGVEPGECAMVGDHPVNDILGAKNAGMKAVLIARHGGSVNCPADLVIKSLSDLLLVI
jgi:putative hydrolase of the HAD superfamily